MNKKTLISLLILVALIVIAGILVSGNKKKVDTSMIIDVASLTCELTDYTGKTPGLYKVFVNSPSSCDDQNGYVGKGLVFVDLNNPSPNSYGLYQDIDVSFQYSKPGISFFESKLDDAVRTLAVFSSGTGVRQSKQIVDLSSGTSISFAESANQGNFVAANGDVTSDLSTARFYVFSEPSEFVRQSSDGFMNNISAIDLNPIIKKVTLKTAEKNVSYEIIPYISSEQPIGEDFYTKTVYQVKKDGVVDDAPGKEKTTPIAKEVVEALQKYVSVN